MHRRHQHINIPTEIVRTIVVIAETGSFSKAGERLGLSQPAISAQVKRLQVMVGGAVFERVAGGVTFTARGKAVLAHARKLLEANDQILSLGGAAADGQPIRLGLSTLYVEQFLSGLAGNAGEYPLNIYCDHSTELAKGLADGYVDVACITNPPGEFADVVAEWWEPFVWVRSPDFLLSPAMAVPLVGWPGSLADQPMIEALEESGAAYRVVFTSADHHARFAAVSAGVGLMGLPARQVREPVVVAKEHYLPAIAPMRAGICVRKGVDVGRVELIIDLLKELKPVDDVVAHATMGR
jgi:DNA-binding transcriptional LysR family regulator